MYGMEPPPDEDERETPLEKEMYQKLAETASSDQLQETKDLLQELLSFLEEEKGEKVSAVGICQSLLGLVAENNAAAVLKYLIEQGVDINVPREDERKRWPPAKNPLQRALYYAAEDTAAILIESGADLGVQDREGNTPLHYAIVQEYCSSERILFLLLDKGADPALANDAGEKPCESPVYKDSIGAYLRNKAEREKVRLEKEAAAALAADLEIITRIGGKTQRHLPLPPKFKKP